MSYKDDVNLYSKLKTADKLLADLQKLIIVYQKNLSHFVELQKRAYNKNIKLRNYRSKDQI